ncbi:Ig-like domain repeat protein [Paenibacillus sp. SI8]|uniref:Ig-like domain repeat protein n=1 Tax=unclassified Paenibacillus TaxID=185978 RepID=UPI0034650E66
MKATSIQTIKRRYAQCCLLLAMVYAFSSFSGDVYAANSVAVSLKGSSERITYGQSVTLQSTVTDRTEGSNSLPAGTLIFLDNGSTVIQSPQTLIPQAPEVISVVSPPGSIPSGYKLVCMVNANELSSAPACPVLKWGEYTFWGYSDTNNMGDFNIVQYDGKGSIVNQIADGQSHASGVRYLYKITLDTDAQTVTFWGQSDYHKTLSWSNLQAANSSASVTTSALSVGSHAIQAKYVSGDGRHFNADSSNFTINVDKAIPNVSLTSSVASTVYGEQVRFTAGISSVGGLAPTGGVIFYDNGQPIGIGPVSSGTGSVASAVYETASLAEGNHQITAVYSGDFNYESRSSAPVTQTVGSFVSSLSLTTSENPITYGSNVTLTARVPVMNSVPVTGSVIFNDGTNILGEAPIGTNGVAQWVAPLLSAGSHTISASYSGDLHYPASGDSEVLTVRKLGSTVQTTLASSAVEGNPVGMDVHVGTLDNSVMPEGSVYMIIDQQPKDPTELDGNGNVHFSLPQLSIGSHTIQAAYRGNGNVENSVSTERTLNVLPRGVAQLDNLTVSGIELSSAFDPNKSNYTAIVSYGTSSVIVTPHFGPAALTVTVNGTANASGSPSESIALREGLNVIDVVVTALDGATKMKYNLILFRESNDRVSVSTIMQQIDAKLDVNGDDQFGAADVKIMLSRIKPMFVNAP